MGYISKNTINFPKWIDNPKEKLNVGRNYKDYFTGEEWKRFPRAGQFSKIKEKEVI